MNLFLFPSSPATGPLRRWEIVGVGVLLLTGAGLFFLHGWRSKVGLHADMDRYIYLAWCLLTGEWSSALHYHYPPGFPALIALMSFLVPDLDLAARLVALFLSSATVIPVYFLARACVGRRAGLLAAVFYLCRFLEVLTHGWADTAQLPFLWSGILAGLYSLERKNPGWPLVAGMLLGASFLIKPEASAFFLLYLLFVLLASARPQKHPSSFSRLRRLGIRFLPPALALAGYLLFTGWYLACYYRDSGRLSLNPKTRALYLIHNYYYPQRELHAIMRDEHGLFTPAQRILIEGDKIPAKIRWEQPEFFHLSQWLKVYAVRFITSARLNLKDFYLDQIAPWVWPALLLAGLWPARDHRQRTRALFLHAFALVPIFLVPVFSFNFPRFYLTLTPWFMIVLGTGTERLFALWERWLARQKAARVQPVIFFSILSFFGLSAFWQILTVEPDYEYWSRVENRGQAARKLKELLGPHDRFMGEVCNPSIWFLAGLPPSRMEITPTAPLEGVVNFARARKVHFLVYFESEFPGRYKLLLPLLQQDFTSPDLTRRVRFRGSDGRIYVIYEILPHRSSLPAGP